MKIVATHVARLLVTLCYCLNLRRRCHHTPVAAWRSLSTDLGTTMLLMNPILGSLVGHAPLLIRYRDHIVARMDEKGFAQPLTTHQCPKSRFTYGYFAVIWEIPSDMKCRRRDSKGVE
jgi:hypothetical protein